MGHNHFIATAPYGLDTLSFPSSTSAYHLLLTHMCCLKLVPLSRGWLPPSPRPTPFSHEHARRQTTLGERASPTHPVPCEPSSPRADHLPPSDILRLMLFSVSLRGSSNDPFPIQAHFESGTWWDLDLRMRVQIRRQEFVLGHMHRDWSIRANKPQYCPRDAAGSTRSRCCP